MDLARENILAAMRRGLGDAKQRGVACLLRGAAGMGKTFLAERFLEDLPRDTATLVSRAPSTGTPALTPICQALASNTEEQVASEVSSVVAKYAGASPVLDETLASMLKTRGARRRRQPRIHDFAPPETHAFSVLSEALRRVGARQRTVLFIDDVQWLDTSSTQFLGFLCGQLTSVPIFVLLSARSNGKEPPGLSLLRTELARSGEQSFFDCALPPLSTTEVIQVSERFLGGTLDLSAAEAKWLQHTSKGIPIYLKEVLKTLRERGELALSSGVFRLTKPPESLILPTSLSEMTLERLRAITAELPEAELVMQYAAICGVEFDARLIGRLVAPTFDRPDGVSLHRVQSILEQVARATGLVTRVGKTTAWVFDHALTREAVLDDLGELARDLHRQVADTLAQDDKAHPQLVAHHYAAAEAWRPAAEHFRRAAEEAARSFSFAEAVVAAQQRERMLVQDGCAAGSSERLDATELLTRCLVGAQRYEQVVDHLSDLHSAGLTARRPRLLHWLAHAKLNLLDARSHIEAVTILRAASRELATSGDAQTALPVETELVLALEAIEDRQASLAAFRRAFALAERAEDPYWRSRVRRLTCIFWQPEKVIELTQQALEIAREHGLRFQEALCLNNLGTQHFYLRQFDHARNRFEKTRAILSSCGGYREDVAVNNLGLVALAEGQHESALVLFREALEKSLAPDDRLFIRANEAVAMAVMGDLETAIRSLFDAANLADAGGDNFYRDCVRFNLARALLLRGDAAAAVRELTACPPRHWITDDALIVAKRASLLTEAYLALERTPEPEWAEQKAALDRTAKPQAWLHRHPWDLCDIQFWQD